MCDPLGMVRDLAVYDSGDPNDPNDDATTVVSHVVYDGFGRKVSETAAVDHLFAFTGRLLDAATGLQNNLNRWYDPSVGRWLSEGPMGFAAGDANLARYVGNQPTTAADPTGLAGGPIPIVCLYASRRGPSTEARIEAYARSIPVELLQVDPLEYEIARCRQPWLSWEEFQWRERTAKLPRYGDPSTPVITADTRTPEQWERDHLRYRAAHGDWEAAREVYLSSCGPVERSLAVVLCPFPSQGGMSLLDQAALVAAPGAGLGAACPSTKAPGAPRIRTWNEFQSGTAGQFSSRAEAAQAWQVYKDTNGIVTGTTRSMGVRSQYLRSLVDDYRTPSWMKPWLEEGRCPPGYDVDHINPLSIGGSNTPANMRLQGTDLHRLWHKRYHPWTD